VRDNGCGFRSLIATVPHKSRKCCKVFILKEYKSQQSTERGFQFIKDPLFFVLRVFLKSTKRMMALAMIMTLALALMVLVLVNTNFAKH
jgi:transposase